MKRILFVFGLALTLLAGCKKSNDVNPKIGYTDLKIISINHLNNDYTYYCYRASKNDTCHITFKKIITPTPNTDTLQLVYIDGWIYDPVVNKYMRNGVVKMINYSDMVTSRTDFFDVTIGSIIRLGFTF